MNQELGSITTFTKLDAWQVSHKLVLETYQITKNYPKEETFGLTSQMRRCAISITSNIAEGFSRQSFKEKVQFYYTALGSVTELQNQLLISRDVGYLNQEKFQYLAALSIKAHKILNGLIKSSKTKIPPNS